MPNPDDQLNPRLGPVTSMAIAAFRLTPQQTFASAREYMIHQFNLIADWFSEPVSKHPVDDIKEELFALHNIEPIFHEIIDPQLDKGPFVLSHMDLRSPNMIVDENLQIHGIIDWEFTIRFHVKSSHHRHGSLVTIRPRRTSRYTLSSATFWTKRAGLIPSVINSGGNGMAKTIPENRT